MIALVMSHSARELGYVFFIVMYYISQQATLIAQCATLLSTCAGVHTSISRTVSLPHAVSTDCAHPPETVY